MTVLLIPGHHHLLTAFQLSQLTWYATGNPSAFPGGLPAFFELSKPIDQVIWAVVGANHEFTRRNPIPIRHREIMVDAFSSQLDRPSVVFGINEYPATHTATAEDLIWQIAVQSHNRIKLHPGNTIVATSEWEIAELFRKASFWTLPMEQFSPNGTDILSTEQTPWEVFNELYQQAISGVDWRTSKTFLTKVSAASRAIYLRYGYFDRLPSIIGDPRFTEDGDLSMPRDYLAYTRELDNGVNSKLERIVKSIAPGVIVDVGCGDGTLLQRLSEIHDLNGSELIGIEPSAWLLKECRHRVGQGSFQNKRAYFIGANVTKAPVLPNNSVDTFLAVSLCHEIWSYEGEDALRKTLTHLFQQLKPDGVFVMYDVISPEPDDNEFLVELSKTDTASNKNRNSGSPTDCETSAALHELSTYGRFERFVRDFSGFPIVFSEVTVGTKKLLRMSGRCLREFIGKKDYITNWQAEMKETYSYWTFSDWIRELEAVGFTVSDSSHHFCHEYLINHTLPGRVTVFKLDDAGNCVECNYPTTNAVIVARKPVL